MKTIKFYMLIGFVLSGHFIAAQCPSNVFTESFTCSGCHTSAYCSETTLYSTFANDYTSTSCTNSKQGCTNSGNTSAGTMAITSNPGDCTGSGLFSGTGHGGSGDYALFIDGKSGSGATNSVVYCRSVSVTSNTIYQFSSWYNNPWTTTGYNNNCYPTCSTCPTTQTCGIPDIRFEIASACSGGTSYYTSSSATVTYFSGWQQIRVPGKLL